MLIKGARMKNTVTNLQQYVKEIARLYQDKDAYKFFENGIVKNKTYYELERDITAIASWFIKKGWNQRHIAILGGTSYSWVISFLAIVCSNNIAIPIDKMLPEEEILNLLVMGDVETLLLAEEFESIMRDVENSDNKIQEIISFKGTRFREMLREKPVAFPEPDVDAVAEILFTSGTTGTSKGVMISQKNIVTNINAVAELDYTQNLKCEPIVLSVLPIHHTFELTIDNLGVLYCGATICINDKLENIVDNIKLFKPAVILIVPAIAEVFYKKVKEATETGVNKRKIAIAKKCNKALSTVNIDARRNLYKSILERFGGNLTNIVVGGAALKPEIVETFDEFGVNIYQGYGLTECAPLVAANNPGNNKAGSVGKPISNIQLRIENQEIMVKGPGVMLGYYKNEEATKEVFSDGWLKTGDLGYQDGDGYLFITGRSKNLIILENGKNIYPEEIEEYIKKIEHVKEAMVYDDGGRISAVIQPTIANDNAILKEIKRGVQKINEKLPAYKRVTGIDFKMNDFPLTTTMKVKRHEVMEWLNTRRIRNAKEFVPAKTAEQKRLVMAFEQALGRRDIGITDDFFEMGGDSLKALELSGIIGIQAQAIYENPTVEKLEQAMLLSESAATEEMSVDVNALIKLNSNRVYDVSPKFVLLTGATGFLGAHILRELQKRKINVVCLARNEERLKPILRYYFPKEYEFFTHKVIKGDIEKEHFGLDDAEYKILCDKVDMVIHTAANVHHAGYYAEFEKTNVIGTQNVIDFCMDAKAVLQYTSTASVNGGGTVNQTDTDAVFDEFKLDIGQNYTQNVYIHSKYKAEERVLIAREKGLKANIFRIGNLTWRMSDGKFQKNSQDNGFLGRCRGLLKIGLYSKEIAEYPIDFTAVDECADAYVRLALHNRVNNIYNLYNPNVFYLDNLCKKMVLKAKRVPKEVFERKLRENIDDKEIAVLSFYNISATSSSNIQISNEFTVNELKKLGFKWSKISLKYLKYMKAL